MAKARSVNSGFFMPFTVDWNLLVFHVYTFLFDAFAAPHLVTLVSFHDAFALALLTCVPRYGWYTSSHSVEKLVFWCSMHDVANRVSRHG